MNTALCILSNPLFYFELFHKEYFGTILILKGTYFLLKSCVCLCAICAHMCMCLHGPEAFIFIELEV